MQNDSVLLPNRLSRQGFITKLLNDITDHYVTNKSTVLKLKKNDHVKSTQPFVWSYANNLINLP